MDSLRNTPVNGPTANIRSAIILEAGNIKIGLRSMTTKMQLIDRSCAICGSDEQELLWHYLYVRKTRTQTYHWESNIQVCTCGFCFVSPAPSQDELEKYYADSYTSYSLQPAGFSIEKRVSLLLEHSNSGTYVEIGSNNNRAFVQELKKHFSTLIFVEPNRSAPAQYHEISSVPSDTADFITAYGVLEHVVDLEAFLFHCKRVLRKGGKIIFEVPNTGFYPIYPIALFLHEHINHFTPQTLTNLLQKKGFLLKDISLTKAGYPNCFSGVFSHSDLEEEGLGHNQECERHSVKACIEGGVEIINSYLDNITKCREVLSQSAQAGGYSVVWGANNNSIELFNQWSLPSGLIVVDSNDQKKDFFTDIPVMLPDDVKPHIKRATSFILCTSRHSSEIIKWLKTTVPDFQSQEIHILDFEGQ
jgi:SAM-dependent methyltransferase